MKTKEVGKVCVMGLAMIFGLALPGVAALVDIAPHTVPVGGPIVDVNSHTWTVTYSHLFNGSVALWDGYYGDAQTLDLNNGPIGGGCLSYGTPSIASIFIDMGTTYNVQQIKLWNIGGGGTPQTDWGFKDVKIYLGAAPNPTIEVGSGALVRGQAVNGQPYMNYTPDGTITLTSGVSGRYLTISGLNNQAGVTDSFKGLSEVGVMVPEPLTLALLGLGGLVLRRRIA